MGHWITGALMVVFCLAGLFLASRAEDGMFSFFGYVLFAFGLVTIVVKVHRGTQHT